MPYTFPTITINNREIPLKNISTSASQPLSDFENSTFAFIKDWLADTNEFPLQTSGSTGEPKEIRVTRKQMVASAARTMGALNLQEGDTAFLCLNTQFVAGKMMLVRALESNLRIVAVEPTSDPFRQLDGRVQPDFAAFVPLQLQTLLESAEARLRLNRMKAIIIGGAAVSPSLANEIRGLSCPVYATYGMTETLSNIALQRLNGPGASGHFTVLPGIKIGQDDRGCLVIRIPEISEPVITNDLVGLTDEKSFNWLGRWDNVINSGGKKVLPEKIENEVSTLFRSLNINYTFFIGGVPDTKYGERVALFMETASLDPSTSSKILGSIRLFPAPGERVNELILLPAFQYTKSGKIHRKKTIESFLKGLSQIQIIK